MAPLSDYLARRPGAETQIAREYLALESGAGLDGVDYERIGDFEMIRPVGQGGQGIVYRARDIRLDRIVALKVLSRDGHQPGSDPMRRARFERESRLASRLEHPNICQIYEAGESEGRLYIAMRWLNGKSLAEWMHYARQRGTAEQFPLAALLPSIVRDEHAQTRMRLDAILLFVEKIARGVQAAHEAGVTHRDLKPANVMVTPDGEPVILDFGLSKDHSGETPTLTESGDVFGTPNYMSPEQVSGDRHSIGPSTDIYALGVILFEAVALTRPFQRSSSAATLEAVRTEMPDRLSRLLPSLPEEVSVVVESCLSKDGVHRPASAAQFANELRRIRERAKIRTRSIAPWTRVWRWGRRNRRLAAAFAGLLAVLITGLITALVLLAAERRERRESEFIADVARLAQLRLQGKGELLPINPDLLPEFADWKRRADLLITRRAAHERALTARTSPGVGAPDSLDAWRSSIQRKFLLDLEAFLRPEESRPDAYHRVVQRMRRARTLRQDSVVAFAEEWAAARKAIRSHPAYTGLTLAEQVGLVPLGPDPTSTLWEFAMLASGSVPERVDGGALRLESDSAIVFVLLPGGTATLGVAEPHGNSAGLRRDDREYRATLAPFFIAKHEATQAQWERASGRNPSVNRPGNPQVDSARQKLPSSRDPINSINWFEARDFARRFVTQLPTEAQWEYAARAGAATVPPIPKDSAIAQLGNFADAGSSAGYKPPWSYVSDADDGWTFAAPVGSYQANPWGLHDMLGNVEEWVYDEFAPYGALVKQSAAVHPADSEEGALRCVRGGGFEQICPPNGAASRNADRPETSYWARGVRLARPITTTKHQ